MITQWYEPETGSAAHPTAIARAIHARGHDLKVLTGFPSYPQGAVHSGYSMSLRHHETRDGIQVMRVPDVPSHDQNAIRRALSLVSFAGAATANVGWLKDVDVILTYLTPATVGAAAWTLNRLHGVPYVLYVQDLWPETVTASGFIRNERMSSVVERSLTSMLRRLYSRAAGVVTISPSMAKTLSTRGARSEPISIPNWVEGDVFRPPAPGWTPQLPPGRTWMMYAGGIGDVQALHNSVRAMSLLSDRPDIGMAFVGDGVARAGLEQLARELDVHDRVTFLGPRPMEQMPALMAEAAAQVVSLLDLPLFRATIPSKVQASMACGAPVVCAVAGDAADLVTASGAGIAVLPESADALAAAFRDMADRGEEGRRQLGEAGLRAYRAQLSAEVGAAHLEQVLQTAARSR
ncbi:glycosyltransferase family 4 protein [Nocardioides sambongensis]|uniref:glycosyltransferase family 4 protein n=1 Tax=Nocardioides sambongensis TaxID=2589074 RepID=UPI00112EDCC3|nr:glycosyltransferase family 4 protein [Nocardioides sambongensis]